MQDYGKLEVVKCAHPLVLRIYKVTSCFPDDEKYGLISQIRRSMASVPANLAEGCGLQGRAQLRKYAYQASGSASETQYWLKLARDLGYLTQQEFQQLRSELLIVRKKLTCFIQSLS
ncbi:MAG: four helix bundle protein [Persicimonas sp.]